MSKGYFHVFHDPEDGFISGKARDVARDMVVRGAFKPYGWLEILIWTGISMFLSVKLCDHFQVESGIVRIIIWPFLGILFYLASRGIFFLSAWITSKKNAGNPQFRHSFRQYLWFGDGSMFTESDDSRLDVSYRRIESLECENGRFILNMEAGKRIVLEKKNFLEGNPNDFESFLRGKMAEEASLELKEDAPRAEVLESEDGIYRLYKAAEWNRIQSGREKYPVSMYLMVFLCVSAAFTFINMTLKEITLPFGIYLAVEAVFAAVCAAHYFLKNNQARSEKALRKAAAKEWNQIKGKADGMRKDLVFFKNGFKVQTEEYITSYDYRNVNTVIASKDTLVVSGEGFFFVALMGTETDGYYEMKKLIESGSSLKVQVME